MYGSIKKVSRNLSSNTSFDPVRLKVFINVLGAYPVGTFVKLDTGEIVIVAGSSKGKDKTRPIFQLLNADINRRYFKGEVVDLVRKDLPCRSVFEKYH